VSGFAGRGPKADKGSDGLRLHSDMKTMTEQTNTTRTGYVAIVGEPNVGKSTLLNTVMGTKLSIVTRKPQTTRKSVLGILTTDAAQIIFRDTPGVLTPKYLLQQKLAGYVEEALRDSDVILLMLDATAPDLDRLANTTLGNVSDLGKPIILVLNKMDLLADKKTILPAMEQFSQMNIFQEVIPMSAKYADNTVRLVEVLEELLPVGPALYDPEMLSEQPERFFVSELIREQVLELYRQEIPYAVEIAVVEYKERPEPQKLYIHAEIVIERASQKAIVIGKKGESLKKLGSRARSAIEEFLGREVYLELFVKVREDWRSSENRLRGFGY
jgi:GTP-binding protein Era